MSYTSANPAGRNATSRTADSPASLDIFESTHRKHFPANFADPVFVIQPIIAPPFRLACSTAELSVIPTVFLTALLAGEITNQSGKMKFDVFPPGDAFKILDCVVFRVKVLVVKHKSVGNVWIMERWLPAAEYAKCTREAWDRALLNLGPYPDRGEYEVCHVFEACGPTDANIEKLVKWVEASREVRAYDTKVWHQNDAEREKKETQTLAQDMIRNKLPAYGGRAIASSRVARSFKTRPILKTAEELGLPLTSGMRTIPNRAA